MADEWVHRPFPPDHKITEIRRGSTNNELATKLDKLLVDFINFLEGLSEDKMILD